TLRGTATQVVADGIVYTGFASGKLVAIDLETGSLQWDQLVALASGTAEIEKLVDVDASPHVTEEIVYATSFNGNLFAFARANGRALWRFPSSSYREVDEGFGHVYMADEKGRVYSINARDGEQRWEQSAFVNRELSSPVVFSGYLVIGDDDGYLHVLSQIDGSVVGRARIDGSGVRAPMRVVEDQLIVYSNAGKLAAYTLRAVD
ncbi:MAG: outer membrane protein assembly factor BamB, partial [Pseudomonadales bacterium]